MPLVRYAPLLGALLAAACATVEPVAEAMPLEGTAWMLALISGAELVAGAPVILRFEPGRISGSDGCNRFSGSYAAQGGKLSIAKGGVASTRMACPPDVMKQADAFMAALGDASSYRVVGQRLELRTGSGALAVSLVRDGSP